LCGLAESTSRACAPRAAAPRSTRLRAAAAAAAPTCTFFAGAWPSAGLALRNAVTRNAPVADHSANCVPAAGSAASCAGAQGVGKGGMGGCGRVSGRCGLERVLPTRSGAPAPLSPRFATPPGAQRPLPLPRPAAAGAPRRLHWHPPNGAVPLIRP
jgi:hypothetical protein